MTPHANALERVLRIQETVVVKQHNIVRREINKRGWDFCRYRPFLETLDSYGIDLVIDIGANEGQFATELRHFGYKGHILSYEPCSTPFSILAEREKVDPKLRTIRKALGSSVGTSMIKFYSDSRFSSFNTLTGDDSLNYVEEEIIVSTLSDEFQNEVEYLSEFQRIFVKIDTQGYEQEVLKGAIPILDCLQGVMMECSLTAIYENQWHFEEAVAWMRGRGLIPWIFRRGFNIGLREYEFDCIFYRENIEDSALHKVSR